MLAASSLQLSHRFATKFVASLAAQEGPLVVMVQEFAAGGDLLRRLKQG